MWSSRELCATCWSVGKLLLVILLLLLLPPSYLLCVNCLGVVCSPPLLLVWFVEDQVAARGLYALSGRSRSGKAADSFATDDDFFAV